jgi:glycerol kinase
VSGSILVVDVGTSGVRGSVIRPDATTAAVHHRQVLPSTPAAGLVEFDPADMAAAALEVAAAALADAGPVAAVGVANQRASTVVWDRTTGEPVGPGLGWQDLRTVGTCLVLKADGLHFAPNQSATKFAHVLDQVDADRSRDLCLGTVDAWIAWHLSDGTVHATDVSNAAVTGLMLGDASGWDPRILEALRLPEASLPQVVDSSGPLGTAKALNGAPPIAALIGDQQASLVGQGCVRPGQAKITFGTGAMLDICLGPERVRFEGDGPEHGQGPSGTFPIVAWRRDGQLTWGVEAIALAAGTNIEWLRDDLGVIESPAQSHEVAAQCTDSEGVMFVPALFGIGTPRWDYGARGTLLGVTRGTGRPQLVRAVLEGVAHTGADLVAAAEADTGRSIPQLRIDGGMSDNATFVQALADATQRPVEVSPEREATTRGAAFLAGLAVGTWASWDDIEDTWQPRQVVVPGAALDRRRWQDACERAAGWIPELTAISF